MQEPRKSPIPRLKMEQTLSSMLCSREEFWDHFVPDLQGCTRSLSIVSPYITVDGTKRVREHLKDLRARDVHITVYIRLPKKQDIDSGYYSEAAVQELIEMGVKVIKSKIHAKVIVIDDYVWWEGSLNVLTFGQSLEQMRRFEGLQAKGVLRTIGIE